jgi:uroporphyrinogen decarboxylase
MKIPRPFKTDYDFEHFRKVVTRETKKGPVPLVELFADPEIMAEATGIDFPADGWMKLNNIDVRTSKEEEIEFITLGIKYMDLSVEFAKAVGYDYVTAFPIIPLPRSAQTLKSNPQQQGKMRVWQNEHQGSIASLDEVDKYPWPAPEQVSLFPIDYVAAKMPQGMKVMAFMIGAFEYLRLLIGFEAMAVKSIEEPELLEEILERLTKVLESATDKIAAHPAVGAVFYGDDLGFNSGLMMSPKWFRAHLFPRLKKIAHACKKHNKPFLFHSCGNVEAAMNDLIDTVGITARHAFQDNIEPVEKFYQRYHDRIAVLGGIDVNLLAAGTPDQVRARTGEVLQACAPTGGICIGTGNSVTNYCKIENYYAMIDAVREWNKKRYEV